MDLESISIGTLPQNLKESLLDSSKTLWVGAVSFEERCSASLAHLSANRLEVTDGLALEYQTNVYPSAEDERLRQRNRQLFAKYEGAVFKNGIVHRIIDPYSFHDLQIALEDWIFNAELDCIVFDITCMTKIHALALAATLSQMREDLKWAVAYSTPENYRNAEDSQRSLGWRDIIVAPLAETATLYNEARGRGVIIAGHEADRLVVAVAELEPAGGLIIIPETDRRPDLRFLSELRNQKIIRQLTKMRSSKWVKEIVGVPNVKDLQELVRSEISKAREYKAPVILFPLGPKILVFSSALQLAREYSEASWFVYPIPSGYDVHYSEGIETTIWLTLKTMVDNMAASVP